MDEYLRLATLTRNSEMELVGLYEEKMRIIEHRAVQSRVAEAELEKSVQLLQQEIDELRTQAGEHQGWEGVAETLRREKEDLAKEKAILRASRDEAWAEKKELSQERARLLKENEELRRELRSKPESDSSEKEQLLQRAQELEDSNKKLSDSLLEMQIKYNKLLLEKTPDPPRRGRAVMDSPGQKKEIVSILRDLIREEKAPEAQGSTAAPVQEKVPGKPRGRGRPRKVPAEMPGKAEKGPAPAEAPESSAETLPEARPRKGRRATPPGAPGEESFLTAIQAREGKEKKKARDAENEVAKIEKESFFANLSFSHSSPGPGFGQ